MWIADRDVTTCTLARDQPRRWPVLGAGLLVPLATSFAPGAQAAPLPKSPATPQHIPARSPPSAIYNRGALRTTSFITPCPSCDRTWVELATVSTERRPPLSSLTAA